MAPIVNESIIEESNVTDNSATAVPVCKYLKAKQWNIFA